MQLFLLHFAGGNCYSYDFLKRIMPAAVKFFALELPGRGKRYKEGLLRHKQAAINDYVQQIRQHRNGEPYIIYGHSMGATLGLSVVKAMENAGDPPLTFIASGNPGPCISETDDERLKNKYLLDDDGFKEELRKLGGLPDEILNNDELYGFFGPVIRADFEILEKDELFEKDTRINTPVYAIMGNTEPMVEQIDNWKHYTNNYFGRQVLPGNHFFIHQHPKELVKIILHCSRNMQVNH
ncbi:thioesterase II family protein [Chitinophaga rupis]|nr:alpha/beta fold hydrolase [Chitinophaga rupis]